MKTYKVIENYKSSVAIPIHLEEGDSIKKIEESNPDGDWPNWVNCKIENVTGWIPKQIIDPVRNIAIVNYENTEFNLEVDEILISEYSLNGWIWGYKRSDPKEFAWAPLNCLVKI